MEPWSDGQGRSGDHLPVYGEVSPQRGQGEGQRLHGGELWSLYSQVREAKELLFVVRTISFPNVLPAASEY